MEIKNDNVSALDANGNVIKDIDVTVEGTITESKDGKTEVSSALNVNLNETAEARHQQAGRPEAEDSSRARTSHRCSVAKHTMDAA